MIKPPAFVRHRVAALLGAAALLGGLGVANARPIRSLTLVDPVTVDGVFDAPTQRGGVSLAQAQQMALARYHGKVVRATPYQQGDRQIYEIRILGDDGRVRTVLIDAQSGAFLN